MQSGSGKLDELHQILNKTQQKLHKFKVSAKLKAILLFPPHILSPPSLFQGVCGSLTNLLRLRNDSKNNSTEKLHESPEAGPSSSKDSDSMVNDAKNVLNEIEDNEMARTEQMRATALDLDKKVASNLDALDSLINKAERAEMTLESQNQQIRKFLR